MSHQMLYRVGNIQAAQYDTLWKPRHIRGAAKYGVILAHGASSTTTSEFDPVSWPELAKLAAVLAEEGIPCIAGYMGGNTYANDAICGTGVNDYMNKALTFMAAQTGCSATKAHVIGVSMGGGVGVRWASLNQAKAASVQGLIPMSNINYAYDNATVGGFDFRTGIEAAWGITYPAAFPAGTAGPDLIGVHGPRLLSSSIPLRLFYASDDIYVRPVDVTDLATAAGGTAINLGTGGHARATIASAAAYNGGSDFSDIVQFVLDNGA